MRKGGKKRAEIEINKQREGKIGKTANQVYK